MSNENIVPQPDFKSDSSEVIGYINETVDPCYSVSFMKKDDKYTDLVELKITHAAVASTHCKLQPDTIHRWLYLTGLKFVEKVDEFKTLVITSKDVVDGQLINHWSQLNFSNANK
ncbi:hypothetical protein P8831_25880 [Priestia megaterium]|uniref:hypothetical protein n=1 Tax=Priestia megaterium TaxID=1404 RepID=UPI002D7F763B|nr:hypothetical protein [Priestia megaterium]MEB4872114.1 hypothetical protein [Priestia megaterium]